MTSITLAMDTRGLFRIRRSLTSSLCFVLRGVTVWLLFASFNRGSTCLADSSTSQIITVVTSDWADSRGELNAFEFSGNRWERALSAIPVMVGKKGMGWGLGLFPDGLEGPKKIEGDRRAPAGVFEIESAFGSKKSRKLRLPYRQTTPLDFWVDDSESKFYNQWVQTQGEAGQSDWRSAEALLRKDGLYELAIVVAHNRLPAIPKRGSAIFMHRWFGPGIATIGCTAMATNHLEALVDWLDASKSPLLVQLPITEIEKVSVPAAVRALLRASD